jgi:hypothetical protein
MNILFTKVKFFLEKLSSKPQIDGLEFNDTAIQYVSLEFDKPRTVALRLPPGIFKNGKLEGPNQFLELLNKLHQSVAPKEPERILRVTVVLPAGSVYTQSFNIPNVGEGKIVETVNLNLQMISPIPITGANMSAQVIGETPDRYDLLGAFADKAQITQLKDLLIQSHFAPTSFEFPALALTRLIGRSLKLSQGSTLVFQISGEGLDIFILRSGHLYFNYFRSWQSIQGEERSIPRAVFDNVVIEEIRKVVNFSMSRFNESPAGVFIITPGFESEIMDLLAKNFNLKAVPFVLGEISPAFYIAFGAALRGRMESGDGDLKVINLGGESLAKTIYNEQILNFVALWRNITVGVLAVLLVVFIFAAGFLVTQSKGLVTQLSGFSSSGSQKELIDLRKKASEFNGLVAAIKSVRGNSSPWYELLSHLESVAAANRIKLSGIDISSLGSPVSIYGTAADYNAVFNFKNVLVSDKEFMNVNLPISQVSIGTDNVASFNLSFQFNLNP